MAQRRRNNINKNLEVTTEAPEDFPRCRLPTLDFLMWMIKGVDIPLLLQKTYEHQKMAILNNELSEKVKQHPQRGD